MRRGTAFPGYDLPLSTGHRLIGVDHPLDLAPPPTSIAPGDLVAAKDDRSVLDKHMPPGE